MDERRADLIGETLAAFEALSRVNHTATGPVWLRMETTIAQLRGLMVIQTAGQLTVGQFAEELGIGKSAGSIMVDRLVQMGLVERAVAPEDRRRAIVRLSVRGERLLAELYDSSLAPVRDWLHHMAEPDIAALARGLRALVAAAEADLRTARPTGSGTVRPATADMAASAGLEAPATVI